MTTEKSIKLQNNRLKIMLKSIFVHETYKMDTKEYSFIMKDMKRMKVKSMSAHDYDILSHALTYVFLCAIRAILWFNIKNMNHWHQ